MHTLAPLRLSTFFALLLGACLCVGGCKQRGYVPKSVGLPRDMKSNGKAKAAPDRTFYQGTCSSRQDIRDLFARVEGAAAPQWASLAAKLVSYGEPAVPQMMANLDSHQESVQVMSAYCLGMIQDPRSLEALDLARRSASPTLRHEAATAMLRMGDRRGLPTMIDALEDIDVLVRGRAVLVLKARTGSDMGYVADGRPADRQAAVARWRAWLARGGGVMAPRKLGGAGTPGSGG